MIVVMITPVNTVYDLAYYFVKYLSRYSSTTASLHPSSESVPPVSSSLPSAADWSAPDVIDPIETAHDNLSYLADDDRLAAGFSRPIGTTCRGYNNLFNLAFDSNRSNLVLMISERKYWMQIADWSNLPVACGSHPLIYASIYVGYSGIVFSASDGAVWVTDHAYL